MYCTVKLENYSEPGNKLRNRSVAHYDGTKVSTLLPWHINDSGSISEIFDEVATLKVTHSHAIEFQYPS